MSVPEKILVIAAHPDDEVLGCGGAMARHIEEGESVIILVLGEGIAARAGVPAVEIQEAQEKLYADMRASHRIIGAGEPRTCALPDNAFDSVPLLSVVHEIEKVMADIQPTLIYTHHGSDTNVDHRIVAQAVDAAVRPMQGNVLREVRAFEVPSSTEWNFTRPQFRPQVFVALSEGQLKKKIDAMNAYASEVRAFPHPRSSEYLEALARVRGGQSGFRAAEAFEMVYRRI